MPDESHYTSLHLLPRLQDPEDDAAWVEFAGRYSGKIKGLMWGCGCRGDAEELTRDWLSRVFEKVRGFDPRRQGSFRQWLRVVARNLAFGLSRKLGRSEPLPDDPAAPGRTPDEEAEWAELAGRLEAVLGRVRARVSDAAWDTFRRAVLDGGGEGPALTDAERQQIFRVRRRLRAEWEALLGPDPSPA